MLRVGAGIDPVRIVGDARNAGEEVAVAHDLGEDDRRHRPPCGSPRARSGPNAAALTFASPVNRVEPHLVGGDEEIGLAVADLRIVAACALRPKLCDDVPRRDDEMRRLVVSHIGPDAVRDVPVVEPRQRHHLVLAQDVAGEAVGVDAGRALRVGHVVDFAVRLLEGLHDAERRRAACASRAPRATGRPIGCQSEMRCLRRRPACRRCR